MQGVAGDNYAARLVLAVLSSLTCACVVLQFEKDAYCGAEVILAGEPTKVGNSTLLPAASYAKATIGDWFRVELQLALFACDKGSTGNLTAVDRVDFQNINIRDADVCLDNIQLV